MRALLLRPISELPIGSSLYFEIKTFLPGLFLVGDKLAMAHGLEERFPFMDNDLVDFAMKIPVEHKLGSLKKEMQNIMYDIDQIINDKKTKLDSEIIRMIIILSQINLHIWNLKDRMEKDKNGYDKNLKLAHQINGIRNQIKNKLLEKTKDLNQSSKRSNFNTDELNGWDFDLNDIG